MPKINVYKPAKTSELSEPKIEQLSKLEHGDIGARVLTSQMEDLRYYCKKPNRGINQWVQDFREEIVQSHDDIKLETVERSINSAVLEKVGNPKSHLKEQMHSKIKLTIKLQQWIPGEILSATVFKNNSQGRLQKEA